MWHRDTKWVNVAGKIVSIDLLNTGRPQNFSLKSGKKKKKTTDTQAQLSEAQ